MFVEKALFLNRTTERSKLWRRHGLLCARHTGFIQSSRKQTCCTGQFSFNSRKSISFILTSVLLLAWVRHCLPLPLETIFLFTVPRRGQEGGTDARGATAADPRVPRGHGRVRPGARQRRRAAPPRPRQDAARAQPHLLLAWVRHAVWSFCCCFAWTACLNHRVCHTAPV